MKRKININRQVALFLFASLFMTAPAKSKCNSLIVDPYPNGLYASQLLEFKPGFWIKTRGALATGWRKWEEETPLHHTRTMFPSTLVLGCPKPSLEKSLTLGHKGHVVVGPVKCFKNGKGPDVLIHEPRSDMNVNETFNVYVTADENGVGPWYPVIFNASVSNANNFLELELDGIVNKRGYPITEFRWVKIEDANSKLVYSHERFSGFEVSAVKFLHQCNVPMS